MTIPSYDAELTTVNGYYDFQLNAEGDVQTKDFFDTALLYSLFGERRATISESPLPERRRGWIGNESFVDFENGSKLWLLSQARITRTTLNLVETAAQNALQWLVDDNLAVKVESEAVLNNGIIRLNITIERQNSKVERRYYDLWNNTGV